MRKDVIIKRIKYLKIYKGITYSFIAKQVGMSATDMSHFVNGRYLSKNKINKIDEFLEGFLNEIK
ncbi:helix-turn-helix domain-containing protein [Clostridium tyrobutyricum]|uniref:helix-turn-helix domain-containing protein n=1 Tax=Clostridium tyrobutyricum TaxID=1519 RepID=UPI001C394D00|nr:helix-turn-helix transcriptional regulator [Clostridium tyrobutyricum]MBV4448884.1 helix-turn-helix domain-containing protein [Clostridium tyrobutyricum]